MQLAFYFAYRVSNHISCLSITAQSPNFKYVVAQMDPLRSKRDEARTKSKRVLGRLGVADLDLTEHETIIAAEVIHPEDISVGFLDVGGLDDIVSALRESVIFPLLYPNVFKSAAGLYAAPKGVLLYGPPGNPSPSSKILLLHAKQDAARP